MRSTHAGLTVLSAVGAGIFGWSAASCGGENCLDTATCETPLEPSTTSDGGSTSSSGGGATVGTGGAGGDAIGGGGAAEGTSIALTSQIAFNQENLELVAYQDGDGGWQQLEGTSGVYEFSVTSPTYRIAYVCRDAPNNDHDLTVWQLATSQTSMLQIGCNETETASVTGQIANFDPFVDNFSGVVGNATDGVSILDIRFGSKGSSRSAAMPDHHRPSSRTPAAPRPGIVRRCQLATHTIGAGVSLD